MNASPAQKHVPPAGPVLSLILIGLVILSALQYYRAVKIQRFLEPALALSQPRNQFTKNVNQIFDSEFGMQPVRGLKVKSNAIFMDLSLLFFPDGTVKASAKEDLRKLAHVFLALMRDDHMRSEINLILVIGRYPSSGVSRATALERLKVQQVTGIIQDSLFQIEPELGIRYSPYFAVSALPMDSHAPERDVVEFRFIPSEFLHIEVLDRLEKYSK